MTTPVTTKRNNRNKGKIARYDIGRSGTPKRASTKGNTILKANLHYTNRSYDKTNGK